MVDQHDRLTAPQVSPEPVLANGGNVSSEQVDLTTSAAGRTERSEVHDRLAEIEQRLAAFHPTLVGRADEQWLVAEVRRLRDGWDTDVDWANKLLLERDEARAENVRLRELLTEAEH